MGNLSENFQAMKHRLLDELTEGKESAIQLQTLLHKLVNDEGSVSGEEQLAMKILRSFADGLSMLSSCTAASSQIASVDCVGRAAVGGSTCTGGRKKKTGVKDRRGCYNRKRTSDSWTTISPTTDDGRAWRKYGQKYILNSMYPRCYYRCTHKPQGCKATKQVQKIKDEPFLYKTTYFNNHTCTDTLTQLPQLILDSDPIEPNLLSFRPNAKIPSPKQESEEGTQMVCFPHSESSGNPSSWPGIMESGSIGSKQHEVWSPRILVSDDDLEEPVSGLYSCASMTGSQPGFDMEVNQLIDINFDEI